LPESHLRPTLVYVITHAMSAHTLLRGQLGQMREYGFDVCLISGSADGLEQVAAHEGIRTFHLEMKRKISPVADLWALLRLVMLLRRLRPEIVNAGTTKAGLLGMLAAFIARVPRRIYLLRGLRLETTQGIKRVILWFTEWISSFCAHSVVCVSHSLRDRFVAAGLDSHRKTLVLCDGSSNGIDAARFNDTVDNADLSELRDRVGLLTEAPVIGFVGRLARDKGIAELCEAYKRLLQVYPQLQMLLVGDFDSGDRIPKNVERELRRHPGVFVTGYLPDPAPYYGLMDVLVFPSHREGFPNVPMEAAAAGLPVVGFEATGTVDAVRHGETGKLVPLHDVGGLVSAISDYLNDEQLRSQHGKAARLRILRLFRQDRIWQALRQAYGIVPTPDTVPDGNDASYPQRKIAA